MLKFEGVTKTYGGNLILEIPNFEIGNGLFWLKGTNGSGKSTFLKMAAGIVPFVGQIEIDGINLKKHPVDYRRLVSYVEAEPLYPSFISGFDLIHFFKKVRREDSRKVEGLIERLSIGSYYKNNIGTYSSGMLKKLSLVTAFIGKTKYIFLDEPLVTIDQGTLPIIHELISEHLAQGVNFIFTSHQAMDENHLPPASELEVIQHAIRFK